MNMSKAPDKIYVCIPQRLNLSTFKEDSKYVGMAYNDKGNLRSPQIEEYIRKDIVDETVEVAEDHAYFAGKEKLREALLEWAKEIAENASWVSIDVVVNKIESL